MNRILLYLDAAEARQKAKRQSLEAQCEQLTELTGDLVDFFVSDEGVIRFMLNGDVFGKSNDDTCSLSIEVALALRDFSDLCLEAATKLEGGGQ